MRLWSVDKQKSLLHGSRAVLILVDSASVGVIACEGHGAACVNRTLLVVRVF